MTKVIEGIYEQFLDRALKGRERAGKKMTKEELVKLAGGRVWTGRQALENGLVDQLGTLEDAIALAKKEANLPADQTPELLDLPKGKNFLDGLLDMKVQMSAESALLEKLRLMGLDSEAKALARVLMLKKEKAWLLPLQSIEVK
jgi:protease-4